MPARISIHCTPRSGRESIDILPGGELSAHVTAPPKDGKANVAVCRLVAKTLGVPKGAVRVLRGETARHKLLEIDGMGQDDAESALARLTTRREEKA